MSFRRTATAVSLLLCGLALAGCGPSGRHTEASATPAAGGSPSESALIPSGTPTALTPPDHIVIIVEENKPADDVLGGNAAPYLSELASKYAVAANYSAIANPSLPNYIALTSGTTAGITTDCLPGDCTVDVPNIADLVEASGRDWRIYGEGMPQPCGTENTGKYATKHIPFVYYEDVGRDVARCREHVVPYDTLAQDLAADTLPDLVFITPDLCNDMHDCSIGTGDEWLSREVPKILESPGFSRNSLLVVTFDEGNRASNDVVTIFAGPAAKRGYSSDRAYTHYSLLHTVEAVWDLQPLTANDAGAPVMQDLLQSAG